MVSPLSRRALRWGHTALVAALFIGALALAARIAVDAAPSYVTHSLLAGGAFALAAAAAGLALVVGRRAPHYNFYVDGLPYLAFPAAMLLAGAPAKGPTVILAVALAANVLLCRENGRLAKDGDPVRAYFSFPR